MKNEFDNDKKGEAVVAKFLDKYFYSKFNFDSYQRFEDKKMQDKGVDLKFSTDLMEYIVDEKAAIRYPTGLPTFAFELSYIHKGLVKEGWFYDDSKETNHYVLIWPIRKDVPPEDLKIEHIYSAELMLVDRFAFQQYIFEKYNIIKEDFYARAREIRQKGKIEGSPNIVKESRAKYHYSTQLAEKPINVVFRKEELLESNSVKSYYNITPYGYENLLENKKGWTMSSNHHFNI